MTSPRSRRNSGYSPSRSATRCIPRPSCSIEMPDSSWKAAKASIRRLVSTPPKSLITARSARCAHVPASISYEPSAGTPSSLKRKRVRERAPAPALRGDRPAATPREAAGQLVARPEQLRAGLGRQAVLAEHGRQAHGLERQRRGAPSSPARVVCPPTSSSPCAAAPAGWTAATRQQRAVRPWPRSGTAPRPASSDGPQR